MSSAKGPYFCLGLNVLSNGIFYVKYSNHYSVRYNTILNTSMHWLRQKIYETMNSLKTPHNMSLLASYGVTVVSITVTIDGFNP